MPDATGAPVNLAALGRPANVTGFDTAASASASPFVPAPIVAADDADERRGRRRRGGRPRRSSVAKRRMPRIGAIACGDGFSLALISWGYDRGKLLYWGGGAPARVPSVPTAPISPTPVGRHGGGVTAAVTAAAKLPADRPRFIGEWAPSLRSVRFLLISASSDKAVALSESGSVHYWAHGASGAACRPRAVEPTVPAAVSALAAGATVALLLVPSYDLRQSKFVCAGEAFSVLLLLLLLLLLLFPSRPRPRPPDGALVPLGQITHPLSAGAASAQSSSGANIGLRQVGRANPTALAAARTLEALSVARGRGGASSRPTQCWIEDRAVLGGAAAALGELCPLRRPADCREWRQLANAGAVTPSSESAQPTSSPTLSAMRCLPAALLLSPRGCNAAAAFGRALSTAFPHVVDAPPSLHPWWAYPSLRNFTDGAAASSSPHMAAALAAIRRQPEKALLVQRATLDARSVGLTRTLRAHGVRLADLLPRVQPRLKVLVLLCSPVDRYANLELSRSSSCSSSSSASSSLHAARLRTIEACASQSPAVECAAGLSASNPLADGAYSLYIRELMRSPPPSQLRVFTEEAFLREPAVPSARPLASSRARCRGGRLAPPSN